ncbi:MAG: hypothetical protein JRJ84_17420 [Deltaproteobacteria bacterium]|nr:hypothetical protein [Deltaproteobacteria bacterium]
MKPSLLAPGCALLLAMIACRPAEVSISWDDDGDGLLGNQEDDAGTDPAVWDSDGDGHGDGAEVDEGTDPLDPEDHPFGGGWEPAHCSESIVPTGNGVADIAENFTLTDQYGEDLSLHDFCDKVVLLESAAFW